MAFNTQIQRSSEEVTHELTSLFNKFKSYRDPWDLRATEWYQKYVGYKEEVDSKRANLHIPKTYQYLDTIRSRLMAAFFKTRPYVDFIPEPESDDPNALKISEQKAEIASALVDSQLERNQIKAKAYNFFTSMLVFPAGIMSVGWKYEQDYIKKKVPVPQQIMTPFGQQMTGQYDYQPVTSLETIFDDNEIQNVDYYDFWVDPDATNLNDARGVFQREWVTEEELIQRIQWLVKLEEGQVYPIDLRELRNTSGGLTRGNSDRLASIGVATTSSASEVYKDENQTKNTAYELLHYWENDRHAILINRKHCLYDGPSPYWRHRKIPFIMASYEPMPNELYGMSAIQLINDLQEETNTTHNQRIDNVSFVINRMWKKKRTADIDDSQMVSSPGGIIDVDNMDDLEPLITPDVAASAYNQEQITNNEMEQTLGTPAVVRGADSRDDKTATEVMAQNTNAGSRFETKIHLYESLGFKRMFMLMDMNNQQFIDQERLIKLGVDDSVQWRRIQPGDLIGEYDYIPSGVNTDPTANKEVRREQLTQMVSQLMSMTQFMMQMGQPPLVDFSELIKEWIQSHDIKNIQKIMIPNEVRQQQMMQQQMMMQQMQRQQMLQQAQQRGQPPPGSQRMGNPQQQVGNPMRQVMADQRNRR